MQGSKFLKVTGILMIIFGALALVLAIIAIAGISLLAAMGASSGLLTVSCILMLVGAVAELVAGIIGVKNWNKLEKAGTCITWGIIVIVLCVISNILTVVGGGDFSVLNLATGLVIPVLYLIGGLQNKKALG